MGGRKPAPDLRRLVSRTPPEGLKEWVLRTQASDLERHGLIYEAEYVEAYGLAAVLDEWSRPKKVKMVRVTCSCCGESTLLNWGYDQTHGYGFVLPDDVEGDWGASVTAAGDRCRCPMCGAPVLVNKRSAIRGFYVTAEASCMSASLVGEDGRLALTSWRVRRLTDKAGRGRLEILPEEACVFSAGEWVRLLGWRQGYSGTCGYFVQYMRDWSQPETAQKDWERCEAVFGLTPELVAASCLPHCKLDVYMAPRPGARHYPGAYLSLYQQHPNVEAVLVHGLPRVLDGLIEQDVMDGSWDENKNGSMDLPQIDWKQTRPAQMLRLTKEELRMARAQCWGLWLWKLFACAKKCGQPLTAEDMVNAFRLGDEHIDALIPHGNLAKDMRYLMHQCEVLAVETDDAGADPIPDAQILLDYWDMSRRLGRDLRDQAVKYPPDLLGAHDRAAEQVELKAQGDMADLFRVRRKILRRYCFAADGLLIRPAASQRELCQEGDILHHCVATYSKRHAAGATSIFFIRQAAAPNEPYYTLEFDVSGLRVRQNRGMYNCARTPEVQAFEDKWLVWVRAGCRRDSRGRPVLPVAPGRKAGAA